jgi:transcriptional regulator with PAS, ATPase and Fis domain
VANSTAMRNVVQFAERAAMNDSIVLITGESGVGKGVIAKLVHDMSSRGTKPMVSVNCGAIPENLLESELFGYVAGAFTGASREGKMGLFEVANGGVVFLDEIGELPMNLQPKLLSFLETGELMRVGSTKVKKVDCRIIAATNRNLQEMVREGRFREDLYYRLSVIPINIPPLRERREDIIPLTIKFLKEINEKNGTNKIFSGNVLKMMEQSDWKGNVRELRNTIERYVVLSIDQEITMDDIPREDTGNALCTAPSAEKLPVCLPEIIQGIEDEYIELAMKKGGSIRKAAKLLDISPTSLFRKVNRE